MKKIAVVSLLLAWVTTEKVEGWSLSRIMSRIGRIRGQRQHYNNKNKNDKQNDDCEDVLEYDMIIVGAGASGMFASGASTMLGAKTLLLDLGETDSGTASSGHGHAGNNAWMSNIGGDCTNAACVPSKAVRSMAKMAAMSVVVGSPSTTMTSQGDGDDDWLSLARNHATNTVQKVRDRESPTAMVSRNEKLDIGLLSSGHFVNSHEMDLDMTEFFSSSIVTNPKQFSATTTTTRVRGKQFILATGASPMIPVKLENEAELAGLPLYSYRTLLRPGFGKENSVWNILLENHANTTTTSTTKKIVVAGGGATACELTQSLARLVVAMDTENVVEVHMVAPGLLPTDDVTLQNAALQLLSSIGNVHFHLGNRVESVLPTGEILLSDGSTIENADAMLLCLGRRPNLGPLSLDNAGIAYHSDHGVLVHSSLRSISSKHVYACGDCASAVNEKPNTCTSTHAAWTGYHAASNALLPRMLTVGSQSVQTAVPRVVYTDPELVSVGLSLSDCVRKYGIKGFDRVFAKEEGTDRADMECLERLTIGFVEIRATKVDGRILGMTACGPTASELANEMSVAIQNRLTVRDIAKSLHSYPSHGYLLHRAALSLALQSIWGSLEACGPLGEFLARPGRIMSKIFRWVQTPRDPNREDFASLASQGVLINQDQCNETGTPNSLLDPQIISGLDIFLREDATRREAEANEKQTNSSTTGMVNVGSAA